MKRIALVLAMGLLVSCGADGEPIPPEISSNHTIGVNSESGAFTRNSFTLFFGGGGSSS